MKKNLKLLVSSVLAVLTFLTSQKVGAMDLIDLPVDHHNVKRIVEGHLGRHPDLLNSSEGKDIVVFLGDTGAGKSTLINYLSGKRLMANEDNDIILEEPADLSAMAIGTGGVSETFLPRFIQLEQLGDLLFYDLPGFMDTRGTVVSLVNACIIKNIIEKARSVKLVFVAGIGGITEVRGRIFNEFLQKTRQFIPNKPIENFSSLIITKSDQVKENLNGYLTRKVDITPILTSWINNNRIDQMSKPINGLIRDDERENLLGLIETMGHDKITNIDIGIIYDAQDRNNIKKIYNREITDIVNQLINNTFDLGNLSSLDITALETKKQYLQNSFSQDISSALDSSPLIQLLRPISKDIYKSSRSKMERNLFHRLINISAEISNIIREQERREARELYESLIQAWKDRWEEAEARYRAEESRRVQAEGQIVTLQQDLQAKNTQIATFQQSLQHEATRYDQASAQIATLQRDLQAEQTKYSRDIHQSRLGLEDKIGNLNKILEHTRKQVLVIASLHRHIWYTHPGSAGVGKIDYTDIDEAITSYNLGQYITRQQIIDHLSADPDHCGKPNPYITILHKFR